jgi:hypothetical protein
MYARLTGRRPGGASGRRDEGHLGAALLDRATMAMEDVNRVVVLAEEEARLIVHVLAVFERLLRVGALDHSQLALLVPEALMGVTGRPDVEMAEVVDEAGQPLLGQLM